MKKIEMKKSINEIKRMSAKYPKSIKEALDFNQLEDEDDVEMEDEPIEEPMEEGNTSMDVMAFVDDIRKKSLKGMAQLADNPDDERYQLLKKIWQICDKKPDQQTAFGNPQQGHVPQRPM